MIRTEQGLEQTRGALADLEAALMHLRRDFDARRLSPAQFALMAEPVVDDIRTLRREIEDYVGFTSTVALMAEPEIARMLEGTGRSPSTADDVGAVAIPRVG